MARAYAYVRMSTDAQLKGDSLQRQIALAEQYALKHGLDLDEELELHDIGLSAYDGENIQKGALGKFLTLVRDGVIPRGSHLLVESFDRISRKNPREALSLFTELQSHGINIVTTADGKVFSPDNDALMDLMWSLMVFARANEESVQKSKRLKSAWDGKRKNIANQKLTGRCPAWLRLNQSKDAFDLIPERIEIVKRIFEDSLSGIGADKIARRLNKEGIKPFRSANGWQKSSVQKILKNTAVFGDFQPMMRLEKQRLPAGEIQRGYFPTIINEDTFWAAQGSIADRKIRGGGRKGLHLSNLFSGLLKCGYCTSNVHFINKGSKGGQHLICDSSRRHLGCKAEAWNYHNFEASFFAFVQELNLEEITTDSDTKERLKEIDISISSMRAKLQSLRRNQSKTYELLMESDNPEVTLKKTYHALDKEIGETTNRIEELENEKNVETSRSHSVSEDVLKLAIKTIQDTASADAFKLRSLAASQIQSFIKMIIVTSGPAHQRDIERVGRADYKKKTFIAVFKNGKARIVDPSEANPLEAIRVVDGSLPIK